MPEAWVLDASALLAFLLGEPGASLVEAALPAPVISRVNLAEVLQKSTERGMEPLQARDDVMSLGLRIESFDDADVIEVARLYAPTHRRGLSFGDRACLALGRRLGVPILHAEHRWVGLEIGIKLRHIRPRLQRS